MTATCVPLYFLKCHPHSYSHCPVDIAKLFAGNASLAHPAYKLQGSSLYNSHKARLEETPMKPMFQYHLGTIYEQPHDSARFLALSLVTQVPQIAAVVV